MMLTILQCVANSWQTRRTGSSGDRRPERSYRPPSADTHTAAEHKLSSDAPGTFSSIDHTLDEETTLDLRLK